MKSTFPRFLVFLFSCYPVFLFSRFRIFSLVPFLLVSLSPLLAFSQSENTGELHGNLELNSQYYNTDSSIGAAAVSEKTLLNGFLNVNYVRGPVSAGLRYEAYLNPLQGYDSRYKGQGIPYRYFSYVYDELEVTAGNFYEQFGSGTILRAYEEKGLGIDNAIDGIRVKYRSHGVQVKGLVGKQRYYFSTGPGLVRGLDGEVNLNDLITKFSESKMRLTLGGSFVSKYQTGSDVIYRGLTLKVPQNVGASSGRVNIYYGNLNLFTEYAYKINDPSDINGYIYKPGEALFATATYSKKGLGIFLAGKRSDNMSFKSDRTARGNDLNINFLPALTKQHTYTLLAYYPYSTQPNGEIGYQAEVIYKIKKETKLGGVYGTDVAINFSKFHGLDTTRMPATDDTTRRISYTSNYFGMGKLYFSDFNIEVMRKISRSFKTIFTYAYQEYNKDKIQGLAGYGTVYVHSAMWETITKITTTNSIRTEVQHLYTRQDDGSWAQALVEWGAGENWYLTATDQYNYGNKKEEKRIHFYNASVTYIKNATRIAVGYGRQRAGYYCAGGVCRFVPASNGVTVTIISSF